MYCTTIFSVFTKVLLKGAFLGSIGVCLLDELLGSVFAVVLVQSVSKVVLEYYCLNLIGVC